jgi:hypothetical protein
MNNCSMVKKILKILIESFPHLTDLENAKKIFVIRYFYT